MIASEHLSFRYSPETPIVIDDVSFTINDGEFTALLGHNGSGKSTLAKQFAAFLLPSGGKIYIDGMDISDENMTYDIRRACGTVFQNPDNQIVAGVVEEDVAFGLENLGVPTAEMRVRVDEALRAVGMYEFRHHAPHLLSGGQKQRVAIAGVIAMRPRTIVMDEPTAMLDPAGRREVMDTILRLNHDYHITIVLITHHMNEALLAGRVMVMSKGRIIMDSTPREVFSRVNELQSVGLTVPATTELIFRLNQNGFRLPITAITLEECARAVTSAFRHNTSK